MRILRGVSSRLLTCGCLVGVYETYDGDIVTIVDARSESCADPSHTNGNVIPANAVGAARSHRGSGKSRD